MSRLVDELLEWAKNSEIHMLIRNCVLHYEVESINNTNRQDYYEVVNASNDAGESTVFIDILLSASKRRS